MFESEFGTWAPGNFVKSRSASESDDASGGGVFTGFRSELGFLSFDMVAAPRMQLRFIKSGRKERTLPGFPEMVIGIVPQFAGTTRIFTGFPDRSAESSEPEQVPGTARSRATAAPGPFFLRLHFPTRRAIHLDSPSNL